MIGTTFLDISSGFLRSLRNAEHPINKDGINNKAKAAADFLGFMGKPDLEIHEISKNDVKDFLNKRSTGDSFNRYRTSLNQIFEYAINELEVTEYNPVQKIKKAKAYHKKRICPTFREVLLLLQAAGDEFPSKKSKSKFKKIRCDERDLLLMIIHATARYGEILDLKWEDVKWGSLILIKHTRKTDDKTEKEIPVPINKDLLRILKRRRKERQQDEWIFWNHRTKNRYTRRPKLMAKLSKKAQTRKIDFHGFRHFVATYLTNNPNLALPAIQEMLGHEDITTTQGYIHPVEKSHRLAAQSLEGQFDFTDILSPNANNIIDGEFKVISDTKLLS